jgi:transcriptional regulator with XRE-family HTH domain
MDQRQDEKIIKDFGENLKKIRTDKGLSIRALADIADLNFGNIGDIELGKVNPTLTTIVTLASALGIDRAELMDF